MALTACRECGGQVSTEAHACPRCGAFAPSGIPTTPAPVAPSSTVVAAPPAVRSRPKWGRILILIGLVGTVIGVAVNHSSSKSLDASQIEQTLESHYGQLLSVQVTASCPRQIPMKKGTITDCQITREDSGKTTDVRVTQDDSSGHYSYQATDPFGFTAP